MTAGIPPRPFPFKARGPRLLGLAMGTRLGCWQEVLPRGLEVGTMGSDWCFVIGTPFVASAKM